MDPNTFYVADRPFKIGPRYVNPIKLGEGAYGMVAKALDMRTGKEVAIKKVQPLTHPTFCQRTLREINILSKLNHENVIELLDCFAEDVEPISEVYLVLELMENDLHRLLKGLKSRHEKLGNTHVKFFTYQILVGLKYIHSANVLHRDLKPANLLINTASCDLKICDFGLSRIYEEDYSQNGMLTEYVATRWYRAPEVMVSARRYDRELDIWSVGCILAEMLSNQALFPGRNYVDQLNLILNTVGSPSPEDLAAIPNAKSRRYVESLGHKPRVSFQEKYPRASPDAIDLLDNLLEFNPSKRCSAEEALKHPFLAEYHDPLDEPTADEPFTMISEIDALSAEELRRMIKDAAMQFQGHAEQAAPAAMDEDDDGVSGIV